MSSFGKTSFFNFIWNWVITNYYHNIILSVKIISYFKCIKKNYMFTFREVSLWDIRNMTDKSINPVLQFEHPKSLTSAFFSDSGTKMVSTCNDDKIRIFNTNTLNSSATSKFRILIIYFCKSFQYIINFSIIKMLRHLVKCKLIT